MVLIFLRRRNHPVHFEYETASECYMVIGVFRKQFLTNLKRSENAFCLKHQLDMENNYDNVSNSFINSLNFSMNVVKNKILKTAIF